MRLNNYLFCSNLPKFQDFNPIRHHRYNSSLSYRTPDDKRMIRVIISVPHHRLTIGSILYIYWPEFSEVLYIKTLFVAPASPWENGYIESFNSELRDELLDLELFLHIDELRYVVDLWRIDYNHYRLQSLQDYMSPAAENKSSNCLLNRK